MPAETLEPLPEDWTTGLAIVAHPDDLEYGAATAIAKWTAAGKRITYALVTSGEAGLAIPPEEAGPLREAEERASAAVVGVDTVEFLGHRDGVVMPGLELRRDLARAIRRHRPDVVIGINFRDSWGGPSLNMADHRYVGIATIDAIRDAANPWVFRELVDEGHEPWTGVEFACFSASPQPTHYVDTTGWLEHGIESLEQHRAYLDHVKTDARKMLTDWAVATGARVGTEHAAAFEVIRP
ncbi:MAG TPA: PIG-L deacetylase family protein [Ilumatobacteraceae bacterium]|nr:PIG-L deacetylase family protein [Ilumatobacteraceae bacterium]